MRWSMYSSSAEAPVPSGDVAGVVPVGDEDVVVGEHRLHRRAQQRREVARERRDEQDARLHGVGVLAEAQQRPERGRAHRLLAHRDLAALDGHGVDAERGAPVREPPAGDDLRGRERAAHHPAVGPAGREVGQQARRAAPTSRAAAPSGPTGLGRRCRASCDAERLFDEFVSRYRSSLAASDSHHHQPQLRLVVAARLAPVPLRRARRRGARALPRRGRDARRAAAALPLVPRAPPRARRRHGVGHARDRRVPPRAAARRRAAAGRSGAARALPLDRAARCTRGSPTCARRCR